MEKYLLLLQEQSILLFNKIIKNIEHKITGSISINNNGVNDYLLPIEARLKTQQQEEK